ncbi:Hpt domain-containing protein [Arenibaculum pallidiluteum]|uniref:Hpt domain-containing protein n=1 Tax=Arenibaculum pallidiluteum TaxID=2812559 RepID=UPI001A972D28|nr:Hpt domain-containing protein [Arenibaculum pallidiluteum]
MSDAILAARRAAVASVELPAVLYLVAPGGAVDMLATSGPAAALWVPDPPPTPWRGRLAARRFVEWSEDGSPEGPLHLTLAPLSRDPSGQAMLVTAHGRGYPAIVSPDRLAVLRALMGPELDELVAASAAAADAELASIRTALLRGDADGAARIAHGMKGMALNLGADALAASLEHLQQASFDPDALAAVSAILSLSAAMLEARFAAGTS